MRCLTSPYILFSFWTKTKTAKWTWPVPSAHPWAFGKNIGIGFGVGKHFCSVVWSLGIAWGNLPPKSTLTQGVPPNPQPIQTKISRPGPPGKFFTILDQKTKFPSNTQPRVCRGTGDVPLQFTLLPKSEKRARGIHSPGKKKFFTLAFSKKISRKLNFLQFFRRQFLRRT